MEQGHAVAYSVKAIYYKPDSSGFDFQWGYWIFQLT
jgi:hypothetical protein